MLYRIKAVKQVSSGETHYWGQFSWLGFLWINIDNCGYLDPEEALSACHSHQGNSDKVEVSYMYPLRGIR